MDEFTIKRESVNCYLSYLESSDSRTIIMALQELLFEIEKGKILTFYERNKVEAALTNIIRKNEDARVRQWCYMLGSFFLSPDLTKICKEKLEREVPKNQTWILALLSHNLDEFEFAKIKKKAENFLSIDIINLSTYLFSDYQYERLNSSYVKKVMSKDDDLAVLWLGWIATFHNQNMRNHKELLVNSEQMSEITRFNDDNILKHIMAAYSRKDIFDINELKFDVYDYLHMEAEHKKWFLTAIWNDKKFIKKHMDYVLELLSIKHLFRQCDKRVREGLARGLSTYDFEKDIVRSVLEWLSYETEISVRHFLLIYILKYETNCKDFREVIHSELLDGTDLERKIIRSFTDQIYEMEVDNEKDDKPIIIKEVVMGDKFQANQVANQGPEAGKNSTIIQIYHDHADDVDYDKLLNEIVQLKIYLKNEAESEENDILVGKLTEAKQAVDKKNYNGAINVLKTVGKELYTIARTIGCTLIASIIKEYMLNTN